MTAPHQRRFVRDDSCLDDCPDLLAIRDHCDVSIAQLEKLRDAGLTSFAEICAAGTYVDEVLGDLVEAIDVRRLAHRSLGAL